MQTLGEYKQKLMQDADLIRSGQLTIAKARAICATVNAVIKVDSNEIQRERINERKSRIK